MFKGPQNAPTVYTPYGHNTSSSTKVVTNDNINDHRSMQHTNTMAGATQHGFQPYSPNGGTVAAVAIDGYAVLAADMRLSTGYRIHCRSSSKCIRLTDKVVLGSAGMQADMIQLHKVLKARIANYEYDNGYAPSAPAIAQMLSTVLYYKRFFPYYTFNILAGVDNDGKGGVYTYDAIGNFERTTFSASGTGGTLLSPILDSQIGKKNQAEGHDSGPKTKEEVVDLMKDVLTSATERDIMTGDRAEIFVIDMSGIDRSVIEMRKD